MPFTNSPDKFFLSGGDINVLLAMVQELRRAMMSLNRYTPENAGSQLSLDTLKRFAKLRIIAYNYKTLNMSTKLTQDEKVREAKRQVSAMSEAVFHASTDAMTLQDTKLWKLVKYDAPYGYDTPGASVNTEMSRAVWQHSLEENEKTVRLFKEEFRRTKLPENRFSPNEIRDLLKREDMVDALFAHAVQELNSSPKTIDKLNADRNYKITKTPKNNIYWGYTDKSANAMSKKNDAIQSSSDQGVLDTNFVSSSADPFPVHGKPYDNLSAEISDNLVNFPDYETNIVDSTPGTNQGSKKVIFRGWGLQYADKSWGPDPMRTFTKDTPFSAQISEIIKTNIESQSLKYKPPGAVRFFIEKLHGRYGDGTPYRKNGVNESQLSPIGGTPEKNFSNRMVFAAYIDNFNDQYTPQSNSYDFLGRSEAVRVYKSTRRTMAVTFSIVADYSKDLLLAMENVRRKLGYYDANGEQLENIIKDAQDWGRGFLGVPKPLAEDGKPRQFGGHIPGLYSDTPESLWHKITFLAQCAYPYYRPDGKMKEQPIIRVRIADFYDVVASIDNLSLDMNEFDHMIDLNPSAIGHIPFSIKVTLGLSIMHDGEPSSDFWGFYNRLEFDNNDADPQTGVGLPKTTADSTAAGINKNSPTSFMSKVGNEGMLETPKVIRDGLRDLKNSFNAFKLNFDEFKKIGINTKEQERKQKVEDAMKSYLRVMGVVSQLAPHYGLSNADIKTEGVTPESMESMAGDVKKGDYSSTVNEGRSKIQQIKSKSKEAKQKFDLLYGSAVGIVSDVSRMVNAVNTQLKNVGVDLMKSDDLERTINAVKSYTPQNIVPRTIGEIFDNRKK